MDAIESVLVQLLSLFDDLLFILSTALGWWILLRLVTSLSSHNLHFPSGRRLAQSEIGVI